MKREYKVARRASRHVRKWILRQPAVKEESITDWLLDDISRHSRKIFYKAFTRSEEARETGADWEWWIVYSNYAFKMRVQAKKVKAKGNNYASIAHTNRYGLQIEKLLNDAQAKNFAPFYALYSEGGAKTQCANRILDEGVYLSGAYQLNNTFILNGPVNIKAADLLLKSVPLSCFFGCPNAVVDFFSFLERYFLQEVRKQSSLEKLQGFHEKLPAYVSFVLEAGVETSASFEAEFARDMEGMNGIVVIDRRA